MKVRNGFVSNSSSSSFIVTKDLCEDLELNYIHDQYDDDYFLSGEEIVEALESGITWFLQKSEKEREELIREEAYSMAHDLYYYYEHKYHNVRNCSGWGDSGGFINYGDMYDLRYRGQWYAWTKEELVQVERNLDLEKELENEDISKRRIVWDMEEKICAAKADIIAKEWMKKGYVVLSYSDNEGSFGCFMEHTVMPQIKSKLPEKVVHSLSHH